jgi:phosphonate transport system substrate-binding protein
MPSFFIIENAKQSPDEFFTNPVNYSGAHDKTALLVQDGTWQAGALSYTTYDKMVAEGDLDPEKCRVIWKTPVYADYNFTAHPALEEQFGKGFIKKLQAALIAIDDKKILDVMQRTAIIKAENTDFDGIKQVAEKLNLL